MTEPKRNLTEAEEKAAHAHRDTKLDGAVEDTFPASDPPSTTPPAGSRKAEQLRQRSGRKHRRANLRIKRSACGHWDSQPHQACRSDDGVPTVGPSA
jgi:hypothetical protein